LNTLLFIPTQNKKSQLTRNKSKKKNILDDELITLKSADTNKEVIKNNEIKGRKEVLDDTSLTIDETEFNQFRITENLHNYELNQPINITNQHFITKDLLDTNLI